MHKLEKLRNIPGTHSQSNVIQDKVSLGEHLGIRQKKENRWKQKCKALYSDSYKYYDQKYSQFLILKYFEYNGAFYPGLELAITGFIRFIPVYTGEIV